MITGPPGRKDMHKFINRKYGTIGTIILAILLFVFSSNIQAQTESEPNDNRDQANEIRLGDSMKALSLMVTGKAPYDAAETKKIAVAVKGHAEAIPKLFPKGSISGPSEALPNIWTDWETFTGLAGSLEKLSDDLGASADTGKTASLAVFAKMGKTCSGCHQDFRKKKE